jgi:branched-chain amino acid transport system substrate-binding protein
MHERGGASDEPTLATDRRGLRRRHVLATAGSAATLSTAGCLGTVGSITGGSGSEDPITIGVLAPNPDSDFIGRSMVRGARVAVNELRNAGGIDGRDVEMVVGDTNSSPLEARRQYQRLILEEDADVTVGIFASESLMAVMEDIAEQQTVHLTSGAATAEASRLVSEEYEKYKYHFRAGPTNNYDLGRTQVDFMDAMAADIGWNSAAVLVEDYQWTSEPWTVYQNQLADTGVDIVMEERYPPATDDFSQIYDEVEAEGADVAFITTAHTGTAALLDWSYPNRPERPPRPRSFAFGGIHVPMQLPGYYDMVGGACRFGVGQSSATATSEISEKTQPFVRAYRNQFDGNNPVYTGYHTYDAITMFADVVEKSGSVDSDDLIPKLEAASFTGSTGTIEFYDRDHEFAHDLKYMPGETIYFQWQVNDEGEGVQEIIYPEKHATSEYIRPPWL